MVRQLPRPPSIHPLNISSTPSAKPLHQKSSSPRNSKVRARACPTAASSRSTKPKRGTAPANLTNPERGVIETKPPGYFLETLAASAQTAKYLQQYGTVLITNLHQFRLLGLDKATNTPRDLEPAYTLTASANDLWSAPLSTFEKRAQTLPDFLTRVMLHNVPPRDSQTTSAALLASYAR